MLRGEVTAEVGAHIVDVDSSNKRQFKFSEVKPNVSLSQTWTRVEGLLSFPTGKLESLRPHLVHCNWTRGGLASRMECRSWSLVWG